MVALFVGTATSARAWAGEHVGAIVNCAQYDYEYHPACHHRWLHINWRLSKMIDPTVFEFCCSGASNSGDLGVTGGAKYPGV